MSSAGGRRSRLMFSVVVLLIISILQIWVCSRCKVGAIRVYAGSDWTKEKEFTHNSNNNNNNMDEKKMKNRNEVLFNRFFRGRALRFNKTKNVFEDSKRKVPSCPDPLHN